MTGLKTKHGHCSITFKLYPIRLYRIMISKAFDKVDHNLLIYKLFNLGVNLSTVSWIKSFLQSRSQSVVVEGKQPSVPVMSGVPQDSVLPDSIKSRARLFADDTIVYMTISSRSDAQTLQDDLLKLEQWESDWSMEFNPDKCEVIRVTKKHNPIIYPYKLHNIELKATKNAKYLGVMINKEFSWKPDIENMTSKAFNTLKFIKRNVQTKKTTTENKGNSIQHLRPSSARVLRPSMASMAGETYL